MAFILIIAILFSFLPQASVPKEVAMAREMIAQRRYDDAVSKLEQTLEAKPGQADALMFMGAAVLYGEMNFLKAQKLFEQSFQAGGGAVFWVNHSHEKLGTEEMADYCRGWLYLRKGEIEFAPSDGEHSFRLAYSDIKEFKQNRFTKLFHIKDSNKTFNFRPRSGDGGEILLTLALYKKFAR